METNGSNNESSQQLVIEFNKTLLAGDALVLKPTKPAFFLTSRVNLTIAGVLYGQEGFKEAPSRFTSENATYGGSTLYVQTNATTFCLEPVPAYYNEVVSTNKPFACTHCCPFHHFFLASRPQASRCLTCTTVQHGLVELALPSS
jgi:hypothetical protein